MDDEISIHLFRYSLGSQLGLLLRLVSVKVLLKYGLLEHAASVLGNDTVSLAGLGMDRMVLFFVCDFF